MTTFGSQSLLAADGNGNGIIDAADYTVWRDQFTGQNLAAASSERAGSRAPLRSSGRTPAVPEPSSLVAILTTAALLTITRPLKSSNRTVGAGGGARKRIKKNSYESACNSPSPCIQSPVGG
jgi:hypothetical protein